MENNRNFLIEELYEIANQYTMEYWGVPFNAKIELVNRDWKRMNGVFLVKQDGTQIIKFSKIKNERRTNEQVLKTLKHELVHWRMYNTKQPDWDTSPIFIQECIRIGASLSRTKAVEEQIKRMKIDYR